MSHEVSVDLTNHPCFDNRDLALAAVVFLALAAVVFLGSRVVLFVSRQVGGLSNHVNDCHSDYYGDDDESGDGCRVVVQASTSVFSSEL